MNRATSSEMLIEIKKRTEESCSPTHRVQNGVALPLENRRTRFLLPTSREEGKKLATVALKA